MSRLIDADALEEGKFHGTEDWTPIECASWQWGWNDAIDAIISNAPTVDPYKHGHWINANDGMWNTVEVLKCSVCGEMDNRMYRSDAYCPYCGAKMDEVEDETD